MRTINPLWAAAAAVSLAAVTGCTAGSGGSSVPPPAASSPAPGADGSAPSSEGILTIRDFAYDVPAAVKPGSMVAVTNAGSAPHTLTIKGQGGFDVEVPGGGTVVIQVPNVPGEYGIICRFHPQMTGTLVVK